MLIRRKHTYLRMATAALSLAACFTATSLSTAYALDEHNVFTDVPRTHWAWINGTLPWAAQTHILETQKETVLQPAQIITEQEFLGMMMRLYPNTKNEIGSGTTEDIYRLARQYNLPAATDKPEQRTAELTRLQVAHLLAAAGGKHYDDAGAIAYMYEHGITKGADGESTIAGYGGDKKVSRVEAIQFLKMAHDKGIASIMHTMPAIAVSNPSTSRFISSSQEVVTANLQKAQTAAYTRYTQIQDRSTFAYWTRQLYETARKMGISADGTLRLPLPAISGNKTLIYHVAADRWYYGEIKGEEPNIPKHLDFPKHENWSVLLIVKEGDRIVGDMYYDTASESIEINNVIIQKHVKK